MLLSRLSLYCTALHCSALHFTALHCTALHCTALHCTALHCTALHCTALQCTALHAASLHCKKKKCLVMVLVGVTKRWFILLVHYCGVFQLGFFNIILVQCNFHLLLEVLFVLFVQKTSEAKGGRGLTWKLDSFWVVVTVKPVSCDQMWKFHILGQILRKEQLAGDNTNLPQILKYRCLASWVDGRQDWWTNQKGKASMSSGIFQWFL